VEEKGKWEGEIRRRERKRKRNGKVNMGKINSSRHP
jgi:hypothetical protein